MVSDAVRVLVATDRSRAEGAALREGAALARVTRGTLGVVQVVGGRSPSPRTLATDALRQHVAQITGDAADVFVEQGLRHVRILERAKAWRADVIVLGAYGPVARRVMRRSSCDVLLARANVRHGRVLAVTDGPETSTSVLRAGVDAARRAGAELEVVRPVGFLDVEAAYLVELGSPVMMSENIPTRDLVRLRLTRALAASGIDAEAKLLDRPAGPAIVREAAAAGAELVVVGYRRTLARRPVAETVARDAPCSVLVIH